MPDLLSQLYSLLDDVVLPNLRGIQACQAEQRIKTEQLNHNLEEFRSEMHVRFAELHIELAAVRAQLEDAMVTLCEAETKQEADVTPRRIKTFIH